MLRPYRLALSATALRSLPRLAPAMPLVVRKLPLTEVISSPIFLAAAPKIFFATMGTVAKKMIRMKLPGSVEATTALVKMSISRIIAVSTSRNVACANAAKNASFATFGSNARVPRDGTADNSSTTGKNMNTKASRIWASTVPSVNPVSENAKLNAVTSTTAPWM